MGALHANLDILTYLWKEVHPQCALLIGGFVQYPVINTYNNFFCVKGNLIDSTVWNTGETGNIY